MPRSRLRLTSEVDSLPISSEKLMTISDKVVEAERRTKERKHVYTLTQTDSRLKLVINENACNYISSLLPCNLSVANQCHPNLPYSPYFFVTCITGTSESSHVSIFCSDAYHVKVGKLQDDTDLPPFKNWRTKSNTLI